MSFSRRFLILPAAIVIGVGFILPVALLLSRSVLEPVPGLENYVRLASNMIYLRILANTLVISAFVTGICAVLAFPVAYTLAKSGPILRALLSFVVIAPFWTSVLVRTFGWMVILQRQGVVNNLLLSVGLISEPLPLIYNRFGTLVGMVQVLLPFMIFPLYSIMRRINSSYMSAAATMGAKPFRAFIRVYLPLTKPGLIGGGTLVFMMSLGFFITPVLLGGPRDAMIANLIEEQVIEFGDWGMAGTLSVALLAATIVALVLARKVFGVREFWGGR